MTNEELEYQNKLISSCTNNPENDSDLYKLFESFKPLMSYWMKPYLREIPYYDENDYFQTGFITLWDCIKRASVDESRSIEKHFRVYFTAALKHSYINIFHEYVFKNDSYITVYETEAGHNVARIKRYDEYRNKIHQRYRDYYEANKEKIKERNKVYYSTHKEKRREYNQRYKEKEQNMDPKYREIKKERRREKSKQYYYANRDRKLEYAKQYAKKHTEKVKEYHHKYYIEHKEELSERKKLYSREHKDKNREYQKKYYEAHKERIKERHMQRYHEKKM